MAVMVTVTCSQMTIEASKTPCLSRPCTGFPAKMPKLLLLRNLLLALQIEVLFLLLKSACRTIKSSQNGKSKVYLKRG